MSPDASPDPTPVQDLRRRFAIPSGADIDQRRDHLAALAETAGVLEVAYRFVDTPIGRLLVAATGDGLIRVAFEREDHAAVLDALARTVGPRALRTGARTDAVARQLEEYFTRRRRSFDIPLDLRLARGFRRQVLTRLTSVAYGSTTTYAGLAAAAGRPKAVRAVGGACAANPLPIVVPCHRVVRSDGGTGGYLAGPDVKRALLRLEASP